MTGETILLGPVSADRYLQEGRRLPGGGCLNISYHWRQLNWPFLFLTRIGAEDGGLFKQFFQRHQIPFLPAVIDGRGHSAAIDVVIQPDGQPFMDNFAPGVWADFHLQSEETAALSAAQQVHAVLVEGMIAALERLAKSGTLSPLQVSADFLDFRHITPARFASLLVSIDIAFIGWPGAVHDPLLDELLAIAHDRESLLVITQGARGVRVVDGRQLAAEEMFFPVDPLPVRGTTIGCGDAFIAYFLAEYWASGDIPAAVNRGQLGGAAATRWRYPLPEKAYAK